MVNAGFISLDSSSCWVEGKAKTPAGKAEQVRPHRSVCDEEAQRPSAESEVLHGNQLLCHKRFSSCIPFVRPEIGFISLYLNLFLLFP